MRQVPQFQTPICEGLRMKVYQVTKEPYGFRHYPSEESVVATYESQHDALQECSDKNRKAISNVYRVRQLSVRPDKSKP